MAIDELAASREGLAAVEEHHIGLKRQITKASNERMRLFDELAGDYTWLRGRLEKQVGDLETVDLTADLAVRGR